MKKAESKSSKSNKPALNSPEAFAELQSLGKKALNHIQELKAQFNKIDNNTKKKLVVGLAGAVALLAGAKTAHKIIQRGKK